VLPGSLHSGPTPRGTADSEARTVENEFARARDRMSRYFIFGCGDMRETDGQLEMSNRGWPSTNPMPRI
jgi:hypothetical protein